jgi:hypothetical protein
MEPMSDHGETPLSEWALPDRARTPLIGELVERIDEALATARASEAAVMTVGAAALDAAEQARRAAELAVRASAALHGPPPVSLHGLHGRPPASGPVPAVDSFSARADRVAERLRRLQRVPLSA